MNTQKLVMKTLAKVPQTWRRAELPSACRCMYPRISKSDFKLFVLPSAKKTIGAIIITICLVFDDILRVVPRPITGWGSNNEVAEVKR